MPTGLLCILDWILLAAFALILICGFFVVLSYTIFWYESANQDPTLMERRFHWQSLLAAGKLIGKETLLLAITVATHPVGWLPRREMRSGPPVILLHGLFHNRACWLWTVFCLRRQGVRNLHTLNLPPWKDLESLTERLAKKIDELRLQTGGQQVDLVGHSMGGMIARNYIQLRGGADKVRSCIAIGSPHHGSRLAPFALTRLGRHLLPGADFLQRLAAAPQPKKVQFTSIFSSHDNLVIPYLSAQLEWGENIQLQGIGHCSLLYHAPLIKLIDQHLQRDETC